MDMMDAKKRLAILCVLASLTISVPAFATETSGAPVPPPGGTMPMGMPPGGFNPPGQVTQGTAAVNIDKQGYFQDQVYTSSGKDENALRVTGVPATLDHVTIQKTGGASSSTEGGDFYGMNGAFLATDGAQVTIKNSQVSSSAKNGNGLFSYGKGTELDAENVTISTTGDNSGGIQTTGGATTRAWNLNVHTTGNSAAAIRSDRGGGTVKVDGGTFATEGSGSPAIYSTAAISVSDAQLQATHSEGAVIEGKNSIALTDCTISLKGVQLTNLDPQGALLRVAGNSASRGWGTAGKNGGKAQVTTENQKLQGAIVVDTISQLDLNLGKGTDFKGTISQVANSAGEATGSINVKVAKGATWELTGDSTVTTLQNQGKIRTNGHKLTVLGK